MGRIMGLGSGLENLIPFADGGNPREGIFGQ